jgi:hypothetical protein
MMGNIATFALKDADHCKNAKTNGALSALNGSIWLVWNATRPIANGILIGLPPIASNFTRGSETRRGASEENAIVAFHISAMLDAVGRVVLNSIRICASPSIEEVDSNQA